MAQYNFVDCCNGGNIFSIDNVSGSPSTNDVLMFYATGVTVPGGTPYSFSGCAQYTTSTSIVAALTAVTNSTAYTSCDQCQVLNIQPACCECLFPTTVTLSTNGNFTGAIAQITFSAQTGGTSVNIGSFTLPYNYSSCDYVGTYDLYFSAYNKHCYVDITGLTPCTILYNVNSGGNANLYIYDFTGNTSQQIPISSFSAIGSTDIAHTQTKFFANTSTTDITEWNLSLSPYSATYNRIIKVPSGVVLGQGLGCINNSYLIADNTFTTPNEIIELNITGTTAITKTIVTLSANTRVSGDMLYTTQGKILVTTENSITNLRYITQYDYASGNAEVNIQIGSATTGITTPFGLFEYNNGIYIADQSTGTIYSIGTTSPYPISAFPSAPHGFNGASQVPCCNTVSFT